jgi:tRNA(adenine34) deaminase
MIKDENMELAISEAKKAAERDEIPVGALIKDEKGNVLALEGNKTRELCDPTAHAEINAIRKACKVRKNIYLCDCTIYVTLEPCSMCIAAIINSRIKKLIYGLSSPKFGASGLDNQTSQDPKILIKNTEIYGGFYETEISKIMKEFFENKRGRSHGNRS